MPKLKVLFRNTIGLIIEPLIRNIPGLIGFGLRYYYYKLVLGSIGKRVAIDTNVYLLDPGYISIGDNTWIDKNVILIAGPVKNTETRKVLFKENENTDIENGYIKIGKGSHIAPNVVLQGHGGLEIGNYVGVASGGKIYTLSHHYRNLMDNDDPHIYKFTPRAPKHHQFLISSAVVMKDNTSLGLNAIILPGSTVGENSWIGVGSVVSKVIEPNCIAIGNPAKKVKDKKNTKEFEDA